MDVLNDLGNTTSKTSAARRVDFLGGLHIRLADGRDVATQGKKNTALLAYLLLQPTHSVPRTGAEQFLWSQRSPEQAKASLRQCLSDLRKQLRPVINLRIESDRREVSVAAEGIRYDIQCLEEYPTGADSDQIVNRPDFYQGGFLHGLTIPDPAYEEWIAMKRLHYEQLYCKVLSDTLAGLDLDLMSEFAKQTAQRLLEVDSCAELAHQVLMRCYFAEGRKSLVLAQYRSCCQVLQEVLGDRPSSETVNLYESIRTEQPQPPTVSSGTTRHVVPPHAAPTYGLSVAVFSFKEIGDAAQADQLGSEIAEEIRIGLTKFQWMSIVSRFLAVKLHSENSDFSDLCRNLRVRYVVDGSIKRRADSDLLSIQLLDGLDSRIVWGETFRVQRDDVQQMQDTLARIICQLDILLRTREIQRVSKTPPDTFSAYDCVIRAISNIQQMTPSAFSKADALFDRAIELDPDFAAVYTWRILWEVFCIGQGWADDPRAEVMRANRMADEALQRDPDDSVALAIRGHFESFINHNFDQAEVLLERSVSINPYSAFAWVLKALTLSYVGQPKEALSVLRRVEDLCPVEPQFQFFFNLAKCVAYTLDRDYEQGAIWGRRVIAENRGFTNGYKPLIACLGHLGQLDEARLHLATLLELEPTFSIRSVTESYPFKHAADRQQYLAGLVAAGVPER